MPRRFSPWSRAFSGRSRALALGIMPRRFWPKSSSGGAACLAGTFVGPFLISPRLTNVLLAGVLTGFLPCGLVYGYLALASSSANVRDGLLTMCIFGAGTGPLMILAGTGASLLSHGTRRSLLRISAVCVVLRGWFRSFADLFIRAHARTARSFGACSAVRPTDELIFPGAIFESSR